MFMRLLLRPAGYLAFVIALGALSAASRILGARHELGFFADRLGRTIWRYPEVTRRGVQMAWLAWSALFVVAISDSTPWDEAALAVVPVFFVWHRLGSGRRPKR
jgi:hypothetical protein